jgi:hypothetical protein
MPKRTLGLLYVIAAFLLNSRVSYSRREMEVDGQIDPRVVKLLFCYAPSSLYSFSLYCCIERGVRDRPL